MSGATPATTISLPMLLMLVPDDNVVVAIVVEESDTCGHRDNGILSFFCFIIFFVCDDVYKSLFLFLFSRLHMFFLVVLFLLLLIGVVARCCCCYCCCLAAAVAFLIVLCGDLACVTWFVVVLVVGGVVVVLFRIQVLMPLTGLADIYLSRFDVVPYHSRSLVPLLSTSSFFLWHSLVIALAPFLCCSFIFHHHRSLHLGFLTAGVRVF